tara:strand:+ start:188 stop:1234 length:1047 start_codon:yes stop_codon:yes gene_type:complete
MNSIFSVFQRVILTLIFISTPIVAEIVGSGASFPYPFLKSIFKEYSAQTNIPIQYEPHGSKNGYVDLKEQRVDFAGIDLYLSDSLIEQMPEPRDILHFPITLSGIGIAYSLPNRPEVQLSTQVLANILIGRIQYWDDPAIQGLNPDIALPHMKIIVITRSKGSGSTYVLTQYLSYLNPAWEASFGVSSVLDIPGTLLAKNSDDMAQLLQQIPGSIGYIGTAYQNEYSLQFAAMENSSGAYILPSQDSLQAAARLPIPEDGRISCIFTDVESGYPLTSFSWLIVYQDQYYQDRSKKQAQQMAHFLNWFVRHSARISERHGFPVLPENALAINESHLNKLRYKGRRLKSR